MGKPAPHAVHRDAQYILTVCEVTTSSRHGHALVTVRRVDALTDAGVRVRITTHSHRDTAMAALHREGYAVRPDSRDDEFGEALLVTGWDVPALRCLAVRATHAVQVMIDAYPTLAAHVLTVLCEYLHDRELAPGQAQKLTVDLFQRMTSDRAYQILINGSPDLDTDALDPDAPHDDPVEYYRTAIRAALDTLDELIAAHNALAAKVCVAYRHSIQTRPERSRDDIRAWVEATHSEPLPPVLSELPPNAYRHASPAAF